METQTASGFYATYQVASDPNTTLALNTAWQKANRRHYWRAAMQTGWMSALPALLGFWVVAILNRYPSSSIQLLEAAGVGFLAGLIYYASYADKHLKSNSLASADESWHCELTDEAWSFTSRSGVKNSIPWKAMQLAFEHSDGWLVKFDRSSVWVYRSPLKTMGLDDEFKNRIGSATAPTEGDARFSNYPRV